MLISKEPPEEHLESASNENRQAMPMSLQLSPAGNKIAAHAFHKVSEDPDPAEEGCAMKSLPIEN